MPVQMKSAIPRLWFFFKAKVLSQNGKTSHRDSTHFKSMSSSEICQKYGYRKQSAAKYGTQSVLWG